MFKSPETNNPPISKEQVVNLLNIREINDPEAVELMMKYIDQCHAEADAEALADPGNFITSNRANIKAEIKIARLYLETQKYKEQAKKSLEDARLAASQSDSTQDLVAEIEQLL